MWQKISTRKVPEYCQGCLLVNYPIILLLYNYSPFGLCVLCPLPPQPLQFQSKEEDFFIAGTPSHRTVQKVIIMQSPTKKTIFFLHMGIARLTLLHGSSKTKFPPL